MPSATINIQSGYSFSTYYGIDRTMPAIMNGRVSDRDWNTFCDQVDEPIQELNTGRKCIFCFVIVAFLSFIGIAIYSFMTFQNSFGGSSVFALFIIPVGLMGGMCYLQYMIFVKYNNACKKIKTLCEETSKKHPLVSYHLRNDIIGGGGYHNSDHHHTYRRAYIEVSISDKPIHQNATTTTTTSLDTTLQSSPQQRLQELEKIKHLLTTQEYEDKRAEILSAV